jgi:hypothetical protein
MQIIKNSPEHTTRSFPSGTKLPEVVLAEEQFLSCDSLRPIRNNFDCV